MVLDRTYIWDTPLLLLLHFGAVMMGWHRIPACSGSGMELAANVEVRDQKFGIHMTSSSIIERNMRKIAHRRPVLTSDEEALYSDFSSFTALFHGGVKRTLHCCLK